LGVPQRKGSEIRNKKKKEEERDINRTPCNANWNAGERGRRGSRKEGRGKKKEAGAGREGRQSAQPFFNRTQSKVVSKKRMQRGRSHTAQDLNIRQRERRVREPQNEKRSAIARY